MQWMIALRLHRFCMHCKQCGMQAGDAVRLGLLEPTTVARAMTANLYLMVCAHIDGSQTDVQKELRSRSRAFELPPPTSSLTNALTFTTDRTRLSLLPPCTKKQQRFQEKLVHLAFAWLHMRSQVDSPPAVACDI